LPSTIPPTYDKAFFSRALEDGDIVGVDITVYLDGYHGDTSRTFLVGDVVSCALMYVFSLSLIVTFRTNREKILWMSQIGHSKPGWVLVHRDVRSKRLVWH